MSSAPHLVAGRAAEQAAAEYLEGAGFRILQRNFRARGGQLDLVATESLVLAIVEVRYRASDPFRGSAASITTGKQQRIIRAARALLVARPELARLPARFDVVEVTGNMPTLACRLIRGAFSL